MSVFLPRLKETIFSEWKHAFTLKNTHAVLKCQEFKKMHIFYDTQKRKGAKTFSDDYCAGYNAALVHQKVTFANFNPTHSHFPMQNIIKYIQLSLINFIRLRVNIPLHARSHLPYQNTSHGFRYGQRERFISAR